MNPFYKTIEDIELVIPVFPLPGVLLLPRGQLPLNIFEKRYLAMFNDAMVKHRLIGIIQPAQTDDISDEDMEKSPENTTSLQKIGCVGRITSFNEPEKDRLIVSLTGIARFKVQDEMRTTTPYRIMRVDYTPYRDDLIADIGTIDVNRDGLLDVVRRYLDANNMSADWEAIEQSSNEALVNSLSIISPYGPREKQALLEAATLAERNEILIALTELVLAQSEKHSGNNDNTIQ